MSAVRDVAAAAGQETRDRIAVSSAGRPGGQRGWGFQAMTDQDGYVHACHGRTGATRRYLQLTLPASGQPVRLARQVTREVLTAWRLAHVQETAVLLVSELVTNAVRSAASTDVITLELEVVQTWLRIEAYRCRPGLAVPRTTGEFDESGFEFALLESLAGKWGVRETVTGRTAWAELDVRTEPGAQARQHPA